MCTCDWHEYVVASLLHRYRFFAAEGLGGLVDASQIKNGAVGEWDVTPFLEDFFKVKASTCLWDSV